MPPGTSDITPLWLAALASVDEQQFNADAKPLPIVGEVEGDLLPASDVAAAEALLSEYDATVQATLEASRAEGECRFFVEFDQGFAALLADIQKMRLLGRLTLLRSRVATANGDAEQAVESAEATYKVSAAMSHQLTIIPHLVRLATANVALRETQRLLNELELSDEQLVRLASHVEALDFQGGLARSLQGERGLGYHMFSHSEQFDAMKGGFLTAPEKSEGYVTRAVDCLAYLELYRDVQAAAREPFPAALDQAAQIEQRLEVLAETKYPLERYNHLFTLHSIPAMSKVFLATGLRLALRDAVVCAIAARQYQAARGELPKSLTALVPEFLPAVPADPFDGQPLRLGAGEDGLTIYSIGRDRKDDGGADPQQSGEPDIAVRIKNQPGSTP